MTKVEGIKDLVPFLHFLSESNVSYSLHHYGDDAITVMLTLLGERIEVGFFRRPYRV